MITSKAELKEYISLDQKALGITLSVKERLSAIIKPTIWKYEYRLRKMEYLHNCRRNSLLQKVIFTIKYARFVSYGYKLGFTIPLNVFGPGLCLAHFGTVVINENARIGKNARVHVGVSVGNSAPLGNNHSNDFVPIIGDNVYLGPGAKVYGKIIIEDNVRIGANAVVNKDVPFGVTVGGVPAKVISNTGSYHGLQLDT